MKNFLDFKNTFLNYIKLTKDMPYNFQLYGDLLKENKNLIENLAIKELNDLEKQLLSNEIKNYNEYSEKYKSMYLNYNSIKTIIEKYPDIYNYIDNIDNGLSLNVKILFPIIIVLTGLCGSVISIAKYVFDNIKRQNIILTELDKIHEEYIKKSIDDETLKNKILNLKKEVIEYHKTNSGIIVSIAIAVFSGYYFFNKIKIGIDIKNYFKYQISSLLKIFR